MILGQVGGASEVSDLVAEGDLSDADPVGSRIAAGWHPVNAVSVAILCQYLNCRFRPPFGSQPCGRLAYAAGLEVVSEIRTHVHSIV